MRLVVNAAAVGLIVCVGSLLAQTAQSGAVVAIRASGYVDVKAGVTRPHAIVLIEGSRITSVGSDTAIPSGADVIDLGRLTLLPGLIDVHTHLLENYEGAIGGDEPNAADFAVQQPLFQYNTSIFEYEPVQMTLSHATDKEAAPP